MIRWGTDSSGRGIYMTRWMHTVFEAVRRHPLVQPFASQIVIVQGAFMLRNGGGAADSSGVHNAAGCCDIRTWNLTTTQIGLWVRASRMMGFPYWRRDQSWAHGGMPEHAHGVLGTDSPHSSGSLTSWRSYLAGGDGLAGPGRDYEWRPTPLVLIPPLALLREDWLMADQADRIENLVKKTLENTTQLEHAVDALSDAEQRRAVAAREKAEKAADKAKAVAARMIGKLGGIQDQLTEIEQLLAKGDAETARVRVAAMSLQVRHDLKEDPDIDGVDNPADRESEAPPA